jgi:superfamily I DNA and RNA helicase
MMLQRNLLYTAITRGKRLVLVIGSSWALQKAIETNTVKGRRTSLAERLAEGALPKSAKVRAFDNDREGGKFSVLDNATFSAVP